MANILWTGYGTDAFNDWREVWCLEDGMSSGCIAGSDKRDDVRLALTSLAGNVEARRGPGLIKSSSD